MGSLLVRIEREVRKHKRLSGFTLVELMVVVAVLAILAAVAIPTYGQWVRRSKTAESYANLKNMYGLAAAYYNINRSDSPNGTVSGYCTVGTTTTGWSPTEDKQTHDYNVDANFEALRFSIADPTYYVYEIDSLGSACGNPPALSEVYTFRARGDLDGDGTQSTFEMSVSSNENNELVRSASFFIVDESE